MISGCFCIQLDAECDQHDILTGLLGQQLLQLGDLGQRLGIAAEFCVAHRAVSNQGNILAGLGSQFLFQRGNG